MKNARSKKRSLLATLGILVACSLVASFSLHTVQINHIHPGGHAQFEVHSDPSGGDLNLFTEYLHGTEKKLFLLTLIGFLLAGAFVAFNAVFRSWLLLCTYLQRYQYAFTLQRTQRIFNIFVQLFRIGLLNPKAY
jgi:hypothetical protein